MIIKEGFGYSQCVKIVRLGFIMCAHYMFGKIPEHDFIVQACVPVCRTKI